VEIHRRNSLWAIENQEGLWENYQVGRWLPFGGISAMPSIHVAIAVLYVFIAFDLRKSLGFIFCGYLLAIQIGSVMLGWHYAVDGYFGAGMAFVIWYAVKRFTVN
jgi:membrane-associated phospholipid phosphatase